MAKLFGGAPWDYEDMTQEWSDRCDAYFGLLGKQSAVPETQPPLDTVAPPGRSVSTRVGNTITTRTKVI